MDSQEPIQEPRVARMVDMKMPLTWLLGVGGAISWSIISMWFSVAQLVKTVDDLQATVKSGNSSVVAIAGRQALVEFRLSSAEDSVKRAEAAILILQQRGSK